MSNNAHALTLLLRTEPMIAATESTTVAAGHLEAQTRFGLESMATLRGRTDPLADRRPVEVNRQTGGRGQARARNDGAPGITGSPGKTRIQRYRGRWEALLEAHLEKHRRYPVTARAMRIQGVAHVRFRMSRAGKLLPVTLSRLSGFDILDRAALDTIRRAQPLLPVPAERADELELLIAVVFFLKP